MRYQKAQPIDLTQEYPCPCRRRKGRLLPITLTEAFGCDRCGQIFAVIENCHVIEQVSSTYPYKKAWRWNGSHWLNASINWQQRYLPIIFILIIILVFIPSLISALHYSSTISIIFWAIIVTLLAIAILWLAYRH